MRITPIAAVLLAITAGCGPGDRGEPEDGVRFVLDGVAICPGAAATLRSPAYDLQSLTVSTSCGADMYLSGSFFSMYPDTPLDCIDLRFGYSACYLGAFTTEGTAELVAADDPPTAAGACTCHYTTSESGSPIAHVLELEFSGEVELF